ncbi:MAG TPA: hypothetical protein VKT52_10975, partial [Ktedonobacterales bacterium]|nr:hypothetical protein [Ktedonobacterales bacterium]
MGDLFKSGSPFTGEQSVVQKPARSRGQTFLAWRDSHRGGVDAPAPPQPARKPSRSGRQRPPSQMPPQTPPPARPSPPSDFTPGGQPPFAADDPWNGTYDAPLYDAPPYEPRMNGGVPAQAPPQADPWAANRAASREWNVLPQSGPPSGPIAGSSSGWRARSPMVDLGDDENPEWMGIPQYGQYGQNGAPVPIRPSTLARYAAANLSRGVMNALVIGLIVVILAISIGVGLTHLASLTAQSTPAAQVIGTPVPTAPVPEGFTGYSAPLFSLSYPSGWSHSTSDQVLSDGTTAHANSFTDG